MDALKASLSQAKPPAKSRSKAPAGNKPAEKSAAAATGTSGRPRRAAKSKA
jgi:DNA end-binding protein Ku